jgi:hypothetical protein
MFHLNINEDDSSLDIALAYFDDGYNVVPLQRSNKKPPSFLGSWEQYKETRPSRELVESWFKDRDNLQVALVCGKFVVVDADSPEAMDWVERNLPACPFKVITGKGMHYYYNNPENYTTFATRRTNETPIERLIDIRGVGGLIIAPYNRHANGQVYKPVFSLIGKYTTIQIYQTLLRKSFFKLQAYPRLRVANKLRLSPWMVCLKDLEMTELLG